MGYHQTLKQTTCTGPVPVNVHQKYQMPFRIDHCPLCVINSVGLQEYAKDYERKHRRKIVLPSVIPWEYGSNRFASQKGTAGFGLIRNTTTKVESSRNLSESNDGVVPWINCPSLHDKDLASQSGLTPFGNIRSHTTKVRDRDGDCIKDINKIIDDRTSEGILKIWSKPNPDAKIDRPFGKHRDAVLQTKGGRRFSQKELNASHAAIPKFHDPRDTAAAKAPKSSEPHPLGAPDPCRLTTSQSDFADIVERDKLDSSRYLAWLGGQLTLQSLSPKPTNDVVSTSYFDRVMSERKLLGKSPKIHCPLDKATDQFDHQNVNHNCVVLNENSIIN